MEEEEGAERIELSGDVREPFAQGQGSCQVLEHGI